MTKLETAIIFAGIPLAIVLVIAGLSVVGSTRRGGRRYRPGRPFTFAPVWFVAAPGSDSTGSGSARALAGADRPALTATPARTSPAASTGGASDHW